MIENLTTDKLTDSTSVPAPKSLSISFPEISRGVDQDEEWCIVNRNQESPRKIRFHDYDVIFNTPGLYEELFYKNLKCCSPEKVSELLATAMRSEDETLRVLDLGAGNGMMGEELNDRFEMSHCVGVDIIPEAAEATWRDRREVYNDYVVADLTKLDPFTRSRLAEQEFNCLTCVAALGFGDIPAIAFAEAFNLVKNDGWVAFNIRDAFLTESDHTGFCHLVQLMKDEGFMETSIEERYRHRVNMRGEPLYYAAIIGRKKLDLPASLMKEIRTALSAA